jgi:hypothetical protein
LDAPQFAERMSQIRARFAAKLTARIDETDAVLPLLAGAGETAVEAVSTVYRRFHEVCGIGSAIGFDETGWRARRLVDDVLVGPFRGRRGLSEGEMAKMREGLEAFRVAARIDMQSMDTEWSI